MFIYPFRIDGKPEYHTRAKLFIQAIVRQEQEKKEQEKRKKERKKQHLFQEKPVEKKKKARNTKSGDDEKMYMMRRRSGENTPGKRFSALFLFGVLIGPKWWCGGQVRKPRLLFPTHYPLTHLLQTCSAVLENLSFFLQTT